MANSYARQKAWRDANPEKWAAARKRYREKNAERIKAKARADYAENPEKFRAAHARYRSNPKVAAKMNASARAWDANNRPRRTELQVLRKLAQSSSRLSVIYADEIKAFYRKTASMGPGFHVDHILPLRSKLVCGLHVPWNLQVLTSAENVKKGNKMPGPEMWLAPRRWKP